MERPIARIAAADPDLALKQEILRRSPFASLAGGSRNAMLQLGRLDRFPRRHHLTEQGGLPQGLFLVGNGQIKLERFTDGRTFQVRMSPSRRWSAGDVVRVDEGQIEEIRA